MAFETMRTLKPCEIYNDINNALDKDIHFKEHFISL